MIKTRSLVKLLTTITVTMKSCIMVVILWFQTFSSPSIKPTRAGSAELKISSIDDIIMWWQAWRCRRSYSSTLPSALLSSAFLSDLQSEDFMQFLLSSFLWFCLCYFTVNHSCSYQMSHFLCIDHRVFKIRRVMYRSQCGCLTKIQCIYCRYLPHIFLNPSSKIYKKFSCVKKEAYLVYFQESC